MKAKPITPSPAVMFRPMPNSSTSRAVKPKVPAAKMPPKANSVTSPSMNSMRAIRKRRSTGSATAARRVVRSSAMAVRTASPQGRCVAGLGMNTSAGQPKTSAQSPARITQARTGSELAASRPNSGGSGWTRNTRATTSAASPPP